MNKNNLIGSIFVIIGLITVVFGSPLGILLIVFGILHQLKGSGKIKRIFYRLPLNLNLETKILRFCIVAYWIVFGLALFISSFEETGLPLEIVEFMETQTQSINSWVIGGVLGFLIVYIIGNIGVFFLQSWGRKTYAAGLAGIVVLLPFVGTMVVTPLYGTLETVLSVLNGVVLCLLYLSPAKGYFEHSQTLGD